MEDTLVAGELSLIPSYGTMIAGIRLVPTQVEECLRVVTRVLGEVRLDEAIAFGEIRVEVELHDLEVDLLKQAIAGDVPPEELVNSGALILLVVVGVLAVDVKDDLADGIDRL